MEDGIIIINWLGIEWREPMTFFTDVLLALFCFIWATKLKLYEHPAVNRWRYFFYIFSISALVGGFSHLLYGYFGIYLKLITWTIGGMIVFAGQQTILPLVSEKLRGILHLTFILMLLLFFLLLGVIRDFEVLKIYSYIGVIGFVIGFHILRIKKDDTGASTLIALGLILNGVAAIINSFQFSLHAWFTHHDLGHIVLIVCLFITFTGVKRLDKVQVTVG